MRKGLFVFASLSTVITTVAQAGFVVTTSRAPITTGTFAGNDGVTLFIRNDGTNGSGTDILDYAVTLSTPVGTVNPRFYIRAWDGTIRNPTLSSNTRADFGFQGFVPGDATRNSTVDIFDLNAMLPHFNTITGNTWPTGDFNADGRTDIFDLNAMLPNFNKTVQPGSFVRFGTGAQVDQFINLQTIPAENSQVYTDGQTVTTFTVSAGAGTVSSGLPDSVATQLAFAVVPTGQSVIFGGQADSVAVSPTTIFSITAAGGGLSPAAVPEPAGLGLIALGFAGIYRRRSSKA